MTGRPRLRKGEPTLRAEDWIEAAIALIAEQGVSGLGVEAAAARLGVTKGSFYWHFRSREDLLSAALRTWEERSTQEAIRALSAVADPRARIGLLLAASTRPPRARSLYVALGAASHDPLVRPVLQRVAQRRIDYLVDCFVALGMPAALARHRALLTYSAYVGLLHLAGPAASRLPEGDAWEDYRRHLVDTLVPPAPKRKRRRP
jgi:AcrR family transcriptional regulator